MLVHSSSIEKYMDRNVIALRVEDTDKINQVVNAAHFIGLEHLVDAPPYRSTVTVTQDLFDRLSHDKKKDIFVGQEYVLFEANVILAPQDPNADIEHYHTLLDLELIQLSVRDALIGFAKE